MTDRTPFEPKPPAAGRPLRCEEWEAMLADALDGSLAETGREAFRSHSDGCPACSRMLGEARQGRQWLEYLHVEPQVPAELMAKILASTSGSEAAVGHTGVAALASLPMQPAWKRVWLPGLRRTVEPRLMMTAAMAFFSLALTLNLAGVRLNEWKWSDLHPATWRSNLVRQFSNAKKPVVRYYDNLRVVYEVESRMRELRRTTEEAEPQQNQQKKQAPAERQSPGNARKGSGRAEPHTAGPRPAPAARPAWAGLETKRKAARPAMKVLVRLRLFPQRADQAGRSLA